MIKKPGKKRGRKAKPPNERRVTKSYRLPPEVIELLKSQSENGNKSVISACLGAYKSLGDCYFIVNGDHCYSSLDIASAVIAATGKGDGPACHSIEVSKVPQKHKVAENQQ